MFFSTINRQPKINLFLQLSGLNVHDGGEYVCEIDAGQKDPITKVHTVEILGKN